jgi:hypothetical protein
MQPYRQGPDRIGQLQRGRSLGAAVARQRLAVQRLGRRRSARVMMHVGQMSNRMRQRKRIAARPADFDGLIVGGLRRTEIPEVALDSAEVLQHASQFALIASLSAEVNGLDEITPGIGEAMLPPGPIGMFDQFFDGLRHGAHPGRASITTDFLKV